MKSKIFGICVAIMVFLPRNAPAPDFFPGRIVGIVMDETSDVPISGADIEVRDADTDEIVATATSFDGRIGARFHPGFVGFYMTTHIPEGRYAVAARACGYEPFSDLVEVGGFAGDSVLVIELGTSGNGGEEDRHLRNGFRRDADRKACRENREDTDGI